MRSFCLAILNYNGRRHLEKLLPTACKAVAQYRPDSRVLVLDNCSHEDDVRWIRDEAPNVQVVRAPKNDYLYSYNWLLERLDEDLVVLLNNDLRLREDFLAPLLRHLQSPDVFSASACSYDWEGNQITSGPARLSQKNGFYEWPFETSRQETCHTLFTSGGFMAVDRKKFLSLGGFNRLYHPAYCEDLDLCFRAWRRGWRCVYEPGSVLFHREKGSWESLEENGKFNLGLKNAFLFQWANLPMHEGRLKRFAYVARIFVTHTARLNTRWTSMWLSALWRWVAMRGQFRTAKVSEAELFQIIKRVEQPYCLDA